MWTAQEQRDLEAAMNRFPEARHPPVERYLRIAASLPQKVGNGRRRPRAFVRWAVRVHDP